MALQEWNNVRFISSVDDALSHVRKVLDTCRNPVSIGDCNHDYEDKYEVVHSLTNLAIAAHLTVLVNLGFTVDQLCMLQQRAQSTTVTLRLKSTERAKYLREEKKKYGDDRKLIIESGFTLFSSQTIHTVTEYIWQFDVDYEIVAFVGVDESTSIVAQGRSASYEVGIVREGPFRPEVVVKPPTDVDITWLLQSLRGTTGDDSDPVGKKVRSIEEDGDLEEVFDHRSELYPHFFINRSATSCRTPRRNTETDDAIDFARRYAQWCKAVHSYFAGEVFPVQEHYQASQRGADLDMSAINTTGLFVPVLPILVMQNSPSASGVALCDAGASANRGAGGSSDDATAMSSSNASVSGSEVNLPMAEEVGSYSSASSSPHPITLADRNEFLRYEQSCLQDKYAAMDASFPPRGEHHTSLITATEACLLISLLHIQQICQQHMDAVNYVEDLLYKQLVAAIGKEVLPRDFDAYMRYHSRKLFQAAYQPKPFCHAIRRSDEHTPEGIISIEASPVDGFISEPILTMTRDLTAGESDGSDALQVTLDASTHINITGRRYVHAFLLNKFQTRSQEATSPLGVQRRPLGYYEVNGAGCMTRPSFDYVHSHGMRRYCGRVVGQSGYHGGCGGGCDGRCGPTNGCQCHECHTLDEEAAVLSSVIAIQEVRCPAGHQMAFTTNDSKWTCDAPLCKCKGGISVVRRMSNVNSEAKRSRRIVPRFRCVSGCDYDYCGKCVNEICTRGCGATQNLATCSQGHPLCLSSDTRPWICDAVGDRGGCKVAGTSENAADYAGLGRWRCSVGCDFDYCGMCCAAKSNTTSSTLTDSAEPVLLSPPDESTAPLTLRVQARQFSSYIVMLGRMSSANSFEPKYAMIVQNKDEISIPLDLETIPSAKEFKDAISSLSPEQQRFAKAFRGMQLESTLFGVLVIQIKPQLEKVLNLPPDSLTKEIALQQNLMELFMKYQIPSDLLSYQGCEEASCDGKVRAVAGHVQAIHEVIEDQRQEVLREAEQKRRLEEEAALRERERRRRMEDERIMRERQKIAELETLNACDSIDFALERAAEKQCRVNSRQPRLLGGINRGSKRSTSSLESCMAAPLPAKPSSGNPPPLGGSSSVSGSASATMQTVSNPPTSNQESPSSSSKPDNSSSDSVPEFTSKVEPPDALEPTEEVTSRSEAVSLDVTQIPKELDERFLALDATGAVRPTIIHPGKTWSKEHQEGLLGKRESVSLGKDELEAEKRASFHLLDALTKAGGFAVEDADLHVVIAATHCFDKSLIDTIVQESVNPIEKVVKSAVIMASALHQEIPENMIKSGELASIRDYNPEILSLNL